MSIRTPVAQLYVNRAPVNPTLVADQLLDDVERLYSEITDIREASLAELWTLFRDVTLALDYWGRRLVRVEGETKMDVAVEVIWDFIGWRGGADALRDIVTRELEDRPLGKITGWVARRILTDGNLRRLVRFVLDLAVRELKLSPR